MAAEQLGQGRINALAVDGNATSECAFHWYMENYHRPEDTVVLVYVHRMEHLPAMGLMSGTTAISDSYREMLEASVAESKSVVQKFETYCKTHNTKYVVAIKDDHHAPGQMICELAKEHNAEIIITGQRGLGAVKRMLLGSTSDYVLHHAHIPVIVVPPPNSH